MELHRADGRELVFGDGMPDGNLAGAHGPLAPGGVLHRKCYFARQAQSRLAAAQAADPSVRPDHTPDWRYQETAGLEVLIGEGHRDHRGT